MPLSCKLNHSEITLPISLKWCQQFANALQKSKASVFVFGDRIQLTRDNLHSDHAMDSNNTRPVVSLPRSITQIFIYKNKFSDLEDWILHHQSPMKASNHTMWKKDIHLGSVNGTVGRQLKKDTKCQVFSKRDNIWEDSNIKLPQLVILIYLSLQLLGVFSTRKKKSCTVHVL